MRDESLLDEIVAGFDPEQGVTLTPDDIAVGKWFGKPCLKVGGRVFAALWSGDMAFKLTGEAHAEALQVPGAQLFDPRGQGHPMKEWVQVPAAQSSVWPRFARLACEYVAGAAQAKKDEIVSDLVAVRRQILDAVASLPPAAGDEVFLGTWSIKDLLAHLVGWDYTNLEAVQEILAGRRPGFWQYYDRDWQSYNARLVAEHRKDDLAESIATVAESHRELIDFLQGVPADEYVKRRKIGTLLRAEVKDEWEHYRQIDVLCGETFTPRRGREKSQ